MKNIITALLIIFILISAIYSCKKYENDEAFIHLRSIKKRVINKWKFDSAYLNTVDVSDSINTAIPNLWLDYKFNQTYYSYGFNDSLISFGTWELGCITLDEYKTTLNRYPNPGGVIVNRILRLDRNDMWLKAYVEDWKDSVEYRFTRIK